MKRWIPWIILTLALTGVAVAQETKTETEPADKPATPRSERAVYDPADQDMKTVSVYHRADLTIGSLMPGPAVIAEDETTTIVPKGFAARINPIGAILMERV